MLTVREIEREDLIGFELSELLRRPAINRLAPSHWEPNELRRIIRPNRRFLDGR
jgi:hypothetical protein